MNTALRLSPFLLAAALAACQPAPQKPAGGDSAPVDTVKYAYDTAALRPAWTASGFKTPESVLYDPLSDMIYVANIDGDPSAKDSSGFISRLSPAGQVLDLEWVKGLDAPKGMALAGGKLYVSNINELVEIDAATGEILARYAAPKSQFLNDVAADAEGTVYVSDSGTGEIYALKEGKLQVWVKDAAIQGPNGLFVLDGRLLVGLAGKIVAINLSDKQISDFARTAEGQMTDGLVPDGMGGYFVSNWVGSTWLASPEQPLRLLIDTEADSINSADIEYIPGSKLLLIPTFFDNQVAAYTVK